MVESECEDLEAWDETGLPWILELVDAFLLLRVRRNLQQSAPDIANFLHSGRNDL